MCIIAAGKSISVSNIFGYSINLQSFVRIVIPHLYNKKIKKINRKISEQHSQSLKPYQII